MNNTGKQLKLDIPVEVFVYDLKNIHLAAYNDYSQNTQTTSQQTGFAHYNVIQHIHKKTGIPIQDIQFTYTAHGKPQFRNIHFSISHTTQYLCISFAHFEHGIDFEHIDNKGHIHWNSVQKWCTNSVQTNEEFYQLWTQIEAYVKCIGTGFIGIETQQITVVRNANKLSIDNIQIHTFQLYDGYLSIAYEVDRLQ